MSEYQDLVQVLIAAGSAVDPKTMHNFMLFVEGSQLVLKEWNGSSFDIHPLVTDGVRPKSSAAYMITPSGERRVVCISNSSTLRSLQFDEDEGEWADDEAFKSQKVLDSGNVAAAYVSPTQYVVVFQDSFKNLVFLDKTGAAHSLPVKAAAGTPTSLVPATDGHLQVYYTSSTDNYIHCVSQDKSGKWADAVAIKLAFEKTPRGLLVTEDLEAKTVQAFVRESDDSIVQVHGSGEHEKIGKVGDKGQYVPATKAECCWPMPRCCRCGRPMYCCCCRCW